MQKLSPSLIIPLIEYSQVLAYVGLGIIFGFAGLTAYKLKLEIKLQKIV